MRDLGKVVLHIPAREGSKRVPRKNMRLMNGKPMISYAMKAAIDSKVTNQLYVNTDAEEIISYVEDNFHDSFKIYRRDKQLASDTASSDEFNLDIINNLSPVTLVMINPVCPLIADVDIRDAINYYKNSDCDTLITSESTQMQTFCDNKPVNINIDEELAPSQENGKITILNWAITIWDANKFKQRMKAQGFASLGDNRVFFDIAPIKATKVSEEKDFLFAEQILKCHS